MSTSVSSGVQVRGEDRHVVGAFFVGAAILPATFVLVWVWLALSPPRPCSYLCFGGLGEAIVSGLVIAVIAGVVAQRLARDVSGWLALQGGLFALVTVAAALTSSEAAIGVAAIWLGVPATAAYLVSAGLGWLGRHVP